MIDSTTVANTIQPHFSKKLLDHAVQETKMMDYATMEELPANIGADTVRFFLPPEADLTATGAPAALTEGVAPTNFRNIAFTPIDVKLAQRGQVAKVTDVATNIGLFKYLNTATDLMGEEFALDVDTIVRNQLVHPTDGLTKRYAQSLADFAAVAAGSLANTRFKPVDFLDAATVLKKRRAPTFGGKYVALCPPEVVRDILNDPEWLELIKTQYADKVFKGEIGELYNIKIVEHTNGFTEDETEGTFASALNPAGTNTTGLIHSVQIVGKGAYGVVNMKKMGASPHKPQIVIVDKPDSNNPLAQYIIAGWKAFWASKVLQQRWGINLRGKSLFVG
jgi:N4-gp56 family major capsid protein